MTTKNLSAKLLAIIGLLAAIAAMCTAAVNAPGLDPVRYVEADATATAIAPALYPTQRYNEEVLPTQQAVEAREIKETTEKKYKWEREVDRAGAVASVTMISAVALGVVLASVGTGVWGGGCLGARGVRAIREVSLPMTRLLTEGPHITEYGTAFHTVTGAVVALDRPQDARLDHGRLIAGNYATTSMGMLGQILEIQREMQRDGAQKLLTD